MSGGPDRVFLVPDAGAGATHRLAQLVKTFSSSRGNGIFVAVVGPSGAGKDTLLRGARARLAGRSGIQFVRRVVTRAADPAHEDHVGILPAEFEQGMRRGAFALHWQANGHDYGLPASIDVPFAAGRVVVANLSRAVVAQARARYGRLAVVHVTAPPQVLAARLAGRGRETAGAMAARLARAPGLGVDPELVLQIDNGQPVEIGTRLLADLLEALADGPIV